MVLQLDVRHSAHAPPLEIKINVAGPLLLRTPGSSAARRRRRRRRGRMHGGDARDAAFDFRAETARHLARAPELPHRDDVAGANIFAPGRREPSEKGFRTARVVGRRALESKECTQKISPQLPLVPVPTERSVVRRANDQNLY